MSFFQSAEHIIEITNNLPISSTKHKAEARDRQAQLTKPPGSLGKLEDLAVWLAGWQGTARPQISNGQCLVFAGNHGVVAQGISPFPAEVTHQMVLNFEAGGAAINQLCRESGLRLTVKALDLDKPTRDMSQTTAMDEDEVLAAMNVGADALDDSCDYLVVGEMGIGNTTTAAAAFNGAFWR